MEACAPHFLSKKETGPRPVQKKVTKGRAAALPLESLLDFVESCRMVFVDYSVALCYIKHVRRTLKIY